MPESVTRLYGLRMVTNIPNGFSSYVLRRFSKRPPDLKREDRKREKNMINMYC